MILFWLHWYHLPVTEEAQDVFWKALVKHLRCRGLFDVLSL